MGRSEAGFTPKTRKEIADLKVRENVLLVVGCLVSCLCSSANVEATK